MTATTSAANPVLVVVDEDRDLLGTTEQALDDRYGRDYCVEAFRSATVALERLEHLAETQQQVALVLSAQWLTGMTGDELLKAVHRLHPHAKRALLIAWQELGDVPTGRAVSSAIATRPHRPLRDPTIPAAGRVVPSHHLELPSRMVRGHAGRTAHHPRHRSVLVRSGL